MTKIDDIVDDCVRLASGIDGCPVHVSMKRSAQGPDQARSTPWCLELEAGRVFRAENKDLEEAACDVRLQVRNHLRQLLNAEKAVLDKQDAEHTSSTASRRSRVAELGRLLTT